VADRRRAVVVGAGLSGLTAARALAAADFEVVVVDKGRGPGGRLATRRIGDATVDHGAQFFTVRSDELAAQTDDWIRRDVAREWNRGFVDDGHPRYVGVAGMAGLAKDLARGLVVETSTLAFAIRPARAGGRRFDVVIDDGTVRPADVAVVTCPLPQSFGLLVESAIDVPRELFGTDYDRTLALLAVLDRPVSVGDHGGVQEPSDDLAFVGDNQHKGISRVPSITVHASPAWSLERWDQPADDVLDALERAAAPWIGDRRVLDRQLKRWRFATPRSVWPDRCWSDPSGTIVVAGDAFAGPRIEGAYLSGRAAAATITA
jgi:hypothetical protein